MPETLVRLLTINQHIKLDTSVEALKLKDYSKFNLGKEKRHQKLAHTIRKHNHRKLPWHNVEEQDRFSPVTLVMLMC